MARSFRLVAMPARRVYPHERVDYRDGARIIARSEPKSEAGALAALRVERASVAAKGRQMEMEAAPI